MNKHMLHFKTESKKKKKTESIKVQDQAERMAIPIFCFIRTLTWSKISTVAL